MNSQADGLASEPIELAYEADLLGNIQQALAGLQGFDVMAFELIQNADDAGATSLPSGASHNVKLNRRCSMFRFRNARAPSAARIAATLWGPS